MDILLDHDGDIALSEDGDIQLADSIRQKMQIRLRWFKSEWRFRPKVGVDYFGKILAKNPDEAVIKREIRAALSDIDEITNLSIDIERSNIRRNAKIYITANTDTETIREEVEIDGRIRSN